jgi:hypothetical protein
MNKEQLKIYKAVYLTNRKLGDDYKTSRKIALYMAKVKSPKNKRYG